MESGKARLATATDYLPIASTIAARLVANAIWRGDACTWVGRDCVELLVASAPLIPTVRSLSGDVYGGTAGIALFLAEHLRHMGDVPGGERTLRGALVHAIESATHSEHSVAQLGGLYSGLAGVGYVAVLVGEILDDPSFVERGIALLAKGVEKCITTAELDVISGLAGVILGLTAIAPRQTSAIAILQRAEAALMARATVSDGRCLWPVGKPIAPEQRHFLTGFSHGASGLAAALLAASQITGHRSTRELALATMRAEHDWFIADSNNWPDLRSFTGAKLPTAKSELHALLCSATWCHGAPGILLTLALEARVTGQTSPYFAPALATTQAAVSKWKPGDDVTLCHGVLGLVEVLQLVSRDAPVVDLAQSAVRAVLSCYRDEPWWPSGVPSTGPNPSLLLGMAGVGHALLRWSYPGKISSVLLPTHVK